MGKNIVLCADGTGNDGGTGSDTNVFKIYQAAKINRGNGDKPLVYYDRGVGTAKLATKRALGGGFGKGFKTNVMELYGFLGRHYKDGDDIYVFGFSRGAATVRAFAGMIEHCGLVTWDSLKSDNTHTSQQSDEDKFKQTVVQAMEFYKKRSPKAKTQPDPPFKSKRNVKIKFLGVWDTVAALGIPQIPWLDKLLNRFLNHHAYDFEAYNSIENVYHAIAVDDERHTFWPLIWDENKFNGQNIEQVWFPGVHSNVGGGYPREGLANVTLDWMTSKVSEHNFELGRRHIETTKKEANPHGKIYDSRSGFAIYYRYNPRRIEKLCKNKMKNNEPVTIHKSVFYRMELKTEGYAPGYLPENFKVIGKPKNPPLQNENVICDEKFIDARSTVESFMKKRKRLYLIFLWSSLLLVGASLFLWVYPPPEWGNENLWQAASIWNGILGHLADTLRYVLPDIFEGAITYGVIQNPLWFMGIAIFSYCMFKKRKRYIEEMKDAKEDMRIAVLKVMGRSS
jgi:uncharacterized protein (DUF2235 family)